MHFTSTFGGASKSHIAQGASGALLAPEQAGKGCAAPPCPILFAKDLSGAHFEGTW